jgi:hypothetical protein
MASMLVLLTLAITSSKERAAAADSDTQAKEQRIQRASEYGDEVIEQLQLLGRPEITVVINYKKDAAKPMPVMLNWFGQRERRIAELTKHLPATFRQSKAGCRRGCQVQVVSVPLTCVVSHEPRQKTPRTRRLH